MESNITINIVEPGSTPIDAGTGTVAVPDTGLFTGGIGSTEATILGIALVALLAIVSIYIYIYRKHKQTKLANLLARVKATFKSKKRVSVSLYVLAFLVSIGTVAGLIKLGANAIDADVVEDTEVTNEIAEVTNGEITIELGDEPVFAYIPTTVTVTEDMPAGYTLKAYSKNPTLSAESTDKTISLVTIPEDGLENAGSLTAALTDNTWGLAVEKPESEAQEIYFSLPGTAEEAIVLTDSGYEETKAGNTYTVYYGVYITPGLPTGTYTGASVSYEVEANAVATVIFDGKGLYFNGNGSKTNNVAKYAIEISDNSDKYSHTPNIDNDGNAGGGVNFGTQVNEIVTIPGASYLSIEYTYGGGYTGSPYNYQGGFGSFWEGSHPDYTPDVNYATGKQQCGDSEVTDGKFYTTDGTGTTVTCSISGDTVTFGYWTQGGGPVGNAASYGYYAVVTGYDSDGNIIYLPENRMVSGEYLIPSSDSYYRFLGWDEDSEATTPTYTSESDIEKELFLVPNTGTELYAIWEPAFVISYNGNGADVTTNMDNVEQYTADITAESKSVDLLASNFSREGYGFVGWSADQNAWNDLTDDDATNDPTIYGPNQTITVDPSTTSRLTLYAVWAPAEEANGEPVTLQNWQGCNSLTATTYNSGTGELTVGKNTITALTDARDGNVYTVARLADGNCWTTENLRLDNEPELSANNTNNPLLPLTNNYAEQITSNYLSITSDDWCTDSNSAPCLNQSKLNTNNTVLTDTSPVFSQDFTSSVHGKDLDANINSYGNYYNWYSATVGNGKQETGSNVTVAGDICPTGWHLPYGGSQDGSEEDYDKGNTSGGFYYLNQRMGGDTSSQGSNSWRSFPNNFVYSGSFRSSSINSRGGYSDYWSSTAGSTYGAYRLGIGANFLAPGSNGYDGKSYGYTVRCVAPAE